MWQCGNGADQVLRKTNVAMRQIKYSEKRMALPIAVEVRIS
ncbi:hypothetical protein BN871_BF_00140 [Paenibacillus sp. P22]|nr:hypothetical protein BN871_BF_00140 [Paenibacillus sp. P22]